MESKKLSFEIDASTIDIRPLLKKDFLELSMRAISSANPNRNGSWFTKESMEKSIETFANKPILGYFENDDFVSHNGTWNHDGETDLSYWDTLGNKGERMLGLIRESDEVKIVEGNDGLYWVELRCALWVQYSFRQVKRLLKDAKRAAKQGGVSKNVSVEVDITDYEILENGVMKINEFNLVGITILGSRNGVKVEPGIEGAGLSVLDIQGKELFEKQANSLRLAYAKLDDSVISTEKDEKEDLSNMTEEIITTFEEEAPNQEVVQETVEENLEISEENTTVQNFEEGCPEEDKEEENTEATDEETHENECLEPEPIEEEHLEENPEDHCEQECLEEEHEEEQCQEETVHECDQCKAYEAQLLEKDAEIARLTEECKNYSIQLEAKEQEYNSVYEKLHTYEHKDFLNQANNLISLAKLDEAVSHKLYEMCDKDEIKSLEDLKIKVALEAFEHNIVSEQETNISFNSPISAPDTATVFSKKESVKNVNTDCWSILNDYNKK